MGWNILRQWSTDWFYDATAETAKLVAKIEGLRARPRPADSTFEIASIRAVSPTDQAAANEVARTENPVATVEPGSGNQPSLPLEHAEPPKLDEQSPISEAEARACLARLRDAIVQSSVANWDPSRSILRDSMIEMFIAQRFDDPDDWSKKVPMYLRQGTAPGEKHFLDQIATIVGRITK